jgi:hypothetical protein
MLRPTIYIPSRLTKVLAACDQRSSRLGVQLPGLSARCVLLLGSRERFFQPLLQEAPQRLLAS